MAKYYGKRKVVDIVEDDSLISKEEVDKGYKNVKLLFKDGGEEVIRQKMVSLALSDEPLEGDLTELREKRCLPVVARIMEVLLEYDIKPNDPMGELTFITQVMETVYKSNLESAIENVWGIKRPDLRYSDVFKSMTKEKDGKA